jgi:hypothetical protein
MGSECARKPFVLKHGPDLGHLTSVALGNDRQWIVTVSSRGYLALWDVRFQQAVSFGATVARHRSPVWRHPSSALGWDRVLRQVSTPFVFAAGPVGAPCSISGRFVSGGIPRGRRHKSTTLKLPSLTNIPCHRDAAASARFWQLVNKASSHYVPPVSSINCGSVVLAPRIKAI